MERINELVRDLKWEVESLEGNVRILEKLKAEEEAEVTKWEAEKRFIRADIHASSVSWYEAKLTVYREEVINLNKIISRYE